MHFRRTFPPVRESVRRTSRGRGASALTPYVAYVAPPGGGPSVPATGGPARSFRVATYNVHRWTGVAGGTRWEPDLAAEVIAELDADVIALQEVLRPLARRDPLLDLAERLGMHVAFSVSRVHKRGELGNAILSRWPLASVFTTNLTVSRIEQRSALAAEFQGNGTSISIVATHLALIDRLRRRQVRTLLEHPRLQGAVVLMGDLNAWRRCRATRHLDRELPSEHRNRDWPPSFPATRPLLALDRIYARGARVAEIGAHRSPAARRGSDHLPILARVELLPAALA